jgi:UDP-glucose 4-epimerase
MANEAVGQTINLGQGSEISINDLAGEVARVVGRSDAEVVHEQSRPGDVLRLYADSAKARQSLGFQPTVSLQQGLTRLKQWYDGLDVKPEELLKDEITRNWLGSEGHLHVKLEDFVIPIASHGSVIRRLRLRRGPILSGAG